MSVPVLFQTGICIIMQAFIGGRGNDYDCLTRALISDGSKLRAKKLVLFIIPLRWMGRVGGDIEHVKHKEWAFVGVCIQVICL